MRGFLGSKLPSPPAITKTLPLTTLPLSVVITNPSFNFSNLSAVSPNV